MTGPRALLLTPLVPARTGNGLAMRAGVLLEALAVAGPVDLVVVPVAGRVPGAAGSAAWARALAASVTMVELPDAAATRVQLTAVLGDPGLRARLEATAPLSPLAAAASPALAPAVVERLRATVPDASHDVVVALRTYLAPLGHELARGLGAARLVVDADDDDEALLRALGDDDAADAAHRLVATWLPEADEVWTAGPADAASLATRHDLRAVRVVPNAVRPPATTTDPPGTDRLLFVGNLTYEPNVVAARALVRDVLPLVRRERPAASVDLVGAHHAGAFADLVGDGVTVHGHVDRLDEWYERADVVVVPLREGAGTRLKILEAAAHARPVVGSTAAVAGLDAVVGAGVVVADGPEAAAAATVALLADAPAARAAALATRREVLAHHTVAAIGPVLRPAACGAPDPVVLHARVLGHDLTVAAADDDVQAALEAMLPTAAHRFPPEWPMHYSVEGRPGAYRVVEEGDLVATVATAAEARDTVHLRCHRRAFEWASRQGWLRLHGALVDLDGVRVLCTGPSGAGKSTLALRLLLDGAAVQGDESVLLRPGAVVAVARPLHLKPGTDAVVPELASLRASLPEIEEVLVLDPGRVADGALGEQVVPWVISVAPLDHVVLLTPGAPPECEPLGHTAALPELLAEVFPVTEHAGSVLARLTAALQGVRCHRLGPADPAAMERALRRALR
ncbi:MAG: glycosyltransferase [Acidimicrobiia bacterium]